jgi:hypothetical protein
MEIDRTWSEELIFLEEGSVTLNSAVASRIADIDLALQFLL